jgi:tetratricopeptide (TPR) repeat protein
MFAPPAIFLLSIPFGLAINGASNESHWYGWFEIIRLHPFMSVLIIGFTCVAIMIVAQIFIGRMPEPASQKAMEESVGGLHERFDKIDIAVGVYDKLLELLPSYPRELIGISGDAKAEIWRLISPFTAIDQDPQKLAREWVVMPPAGVAGLTAIGRLVVAEILISHGQPVAGLGHLHAATRLGTPSRAYWLIRSAQLSWQLDGDDSTFAIERMAEVAEIDGDYPLYLAIMKDRAGDPEGILSVLENWQPSTLWEVDSRYLFRAHAYVKLDRLSAAIDLLAEIADTTENAGLIIQLAQLLRFRSIQGGGDSRWKDAFRSVNYALRARNIRRTWRGDSAEAIVEASQGYIAANDPAQIWSITRPQPDGDALEYEASDSRVLPFAAIGAAMIGRLAEAKQIGSSTADLSIRNLIEAEILSTQPTDGRNSEAISAWRKVYRESESDIEKIRALRGMAMAGEMDADAVEDLRERNPQAAADIELIYKVASISGATADVELRQLEPQTLLASMRRAELIRKDDPELAASILEDAMDRWNDPHLLLLAVDCYIGARKWEKADLAALKAISNGGVLWPGRATVLRRIVQIQSELGDWPKIAEASRSLLEIDSFDLDARWGLAYAEYRSGYISEAWQTLERSPVELDINIASRACFHLDLLRRFAGIRRVAEAALLYMRRFSDDASVQAAAVNAVSFRVDRSELPEEIGEQFRTAWGEFIQEHPDSGFVQRFTLSEEGEPLAEIEEFLRTEDAKYREVVEMIRTNGLPVGFLTRVIGKPYASIFPYRPLGYHWIASQLDKDIESDLSSARSACSGTCFVDASALYTLTIIPEFRDILLSLVSRTSIIDAALRDFIAADDMFSIPADGTMGYDKDGGHIVLTEPDADIVERHQRQAGLMLETARTFRRVIHPALVELKQFNDQWEPVWILTLDAAKKHGAAVWADDVGLRGVARSVGIRTFDTWSLTRLAFERGLINVAQLEQIRAQLLREFVVDLPFSKTALVRVAEADKWLPGSTSLILSRPASWADPESGADFFFIAFRSAHPDNLFAWARAAVEGLLNASPPNALISNMIQLTFTALREPRTGPRHVAAIFMALDSTMPDQKTAVTNGALRRMWAYEKDAHGVLEGMTVLLYLVSALEDGDRQYAVQLVLRDS